MLLSLELAEEAIAVDPYHREKRFEVDRVVYDANEAGILIAYSVVGDEIVYLTFIDLFAGRSAGAVGPRRVPYT